MLIKHYLSLSKTLCPTAATSCGSRSRTFDIRRLVAYSLMSCTVLLGAGGCTIVPKPASPSAKMERDNQPERSDAQMHGSVVTRNERFVVYQPGAEDTLASLARDFLGSAERAWEIAQFNEVTSPTPGQALVVPLRPVNALGISSKGYQTVPILCYHRIGPRPNLMVMPRETFAGQMEYLAENGYNVIRLADLPDFLSGKRALPPRAVVLSFDDGHISTYQHAYPILRKHGFAATFFVYSDFLGGGEAMTWAQINEMTQSGLIDIQSHSKSHANLIVRLTQENDQRYRERVDTEMRVPRDTIERNAGVKVTHYAFPYGDANQVVLERLVQTGHQLGLTVNPGGNAFFANPLLLQRTMIFGGASMESFRSALQVFRNMNLQ